MCGRYVLFSDPEMAEIRDIIEEVQRKNQDIKTGEIFPTDRAPVLIRENGVLIPKAAHKKQQLKTRKMEPAASTDTADSTKSALKDLKDSLRFWELARLYTF